MKTIQTYTPVINNYGFGCYRSEMEPDSSGEWVRYEDYKELLAYVESQIILQRIKDPETLLHDQTNSDTITHAQYMKPLTLKAYTPPKGYMITRFATLAERKAIGREALVKALAPEIWNMLHDLQGKRVRIRYWNVLQDWNLIWRDGSVEARLRTVWQTRYFNYDEFVSEMMKCEPTYVQRLRKLCHKALRDEKALRGNERKLEEQKEEVVRKVKINIDLEIEAWF